MGETEGRVRYCRKCLIRDLMEGESFYVSLKNAMDAIPEEDRSPQQEYDRRLELCRVCERLAEGMCRACGCYVEVRALRKNQDCPYGRWEAEHASNE